MTSPANPVIGRLLLVIARKDEREKKRENQRESKRNKKNKKLDKSKERETNERAK